mgnify:CR=1 FL=1
MIEAAASAPVGTHQFCYFCMVPGPPGEAPIEFTQEMTVEVLSPPDCLTFDAATCPADRCVFSTSLNECHPIPPECITFISATTCPADRCLFDATLNECHDLPPILPDCSSFATNDTCPTDRCAFDTQCFKKPEPNQYLPSSGVSREVFKLFDLVNRLRVEPTFLIAPLEEVIKVSDPDGTSPNTIIVNGTFS